MYDTEFAMPRFSVRNATPQQDKCHTSASLNCGIIDTQMWHSGHQPASLQIKSFFNRQLYIVNCKLYIVNGKL